MPLRFWASGDCVSWRRASVLRRGGSILVGRRRRRRLCLGAQLGAVSSAGHLTFGLNLLRAAVGPPGAVGRPHTLAASTSRSEGSLMMVDVNRGRSLRALFLAALTALFGAQVGLLAAAVVMGVHGQLRGSVARSALSAGAPEGPACELGKGAVKSTGITGDSIGFHLGDEGDAPLSSSGHRRGAARGSLRRGGAHGLDGSGEGSRVDAVLDWGSCAAGGVRPIRRCSIRSCDARVSLGFGGDRTAERADDGAALRRRARAHGRSVDIADIRVSSITPEFSCSLARPLGAR